MLKNCITSSGLLFLVFGLILLPLTTTAGVTNDVCADCHSEVSEAFNATPHGVYFSDNADLSKASCESCHGSGMAHVESGGDPAEIINPSKTDQFGSSMLCLTCHKSNKFDDWAFSAHNNGNVNCANCPKVHGDHSQTMTKKSPELCYDCHTDVRAASYMPSHHPIAEGKLDCSDCHNPHGGPARLTGDNSGRELCFSCHAEKEGPFVYEHAPVSEDCMVCHPPHGSVADSMSSAMARDWERRWTGPDWSRSSQFRLSIVATVPVRMIRFNS